MEEKCQNTKEFQIRFHGIQSLFKLINVKYICQIKKIERYFFKKKKQQISLILKTLGNEYQITYFLVKYILRILLLCRLLCHYDDQYINYQKMNFNKQDINLPQFDANDITSFHITSKTFRNGGFRLEQEDLNDKHIFHNYGQGYAQISLAYGSAYLISKIITVKQDATKIKQVAVIGSGINALMTSLQLLKRGYKVTLYMKQITVKKSNDNKKMIQNQEGLVLWYPGGYDNCDPLKHELIAKHSFQFLKQCLSSNRYQSLKQVDCYFCGPKIEQLRQNVTQYINHNVKQVQLNFGNERIEQFVNYRTILINSELFAQQIFTELKLRNAVIVQKQIKTIDDVLSLKQSWIFNCLGLQVKQIFGDSNIKQVKRSFYTLNKKNTPQYLSIWVSSEIEKQQDYTIVIDNKNIQISYQNAQVKQNEKIKEIAEKVLSRAYHYVKQRTVKPYRL